MYNDVARASAKTMWTNQKNNKPGKNRVEKRKKKNAKKFLYSFVHFVLSAVRIRES